MRTLADVRPGTDAVVGTLDALEAGWREILQAYGVVPGRRVRVLQHAPVTVVEVDHTQLAFEAALTRGIEIVP